MLARVSNDVSNFRLHRKLDGTAQVAPRPAATGSQLPGPLVPLFMNSQPKTAMQISSVP